MEDNRIAAYQKVVNLLVCEYPQEILEVLLQVRLPS